MARSSLRSSASPGGARRRAAPRQLEQAVLFDIYEGKGIAPGRKSLAYTLTYRASDRTLTDDEVNAAHQRIADAVVQELQAEIRDA